MTALFAEQAVLPGGLARDVRIEVTDGRFSAVVQGGSSSGAERLTGVVYPGFANAHSHAFHRALRGRTHADGGTFWTWREAMYAVARRLDPDSYLQLARAVYAEMALSGVSTVGEFHYLHHAPGGLRYDDPNAMAEALRQAAAEAGIRITLLDTAYLAGGLDAGGHLPLDAVQERFSDGDVDGWQTRVTRLQDSDGFRVAAAIHSVRAVPREVLGEVRAAAGKLGGRHGGQSPLHVHLSEQPAENEACVAFYGRTPTALLDDEGVLDAATTAVHATHLTEADIGLLGSRRSTACFCPTTERDLADGIGPARSLREAGAVLSLGSDQNAVVDLIEEAKALEAHERLNTLQRGRFRPEELLSALTNHPSLGWADAGTIAVGQRADLVCVRADTVRTAGARADQLLLAATASDIDSVYVDGRPIVQQGRHRLGDIGQLLNAAIAPLWEQR
ncbi:formimidoylglutamate deiminase [Jatrophihabitans telluris]|uniref:Formimidoylglutamate deiminase n=1 Tax=Jatrophihabitans telluris TaxID=2038343 RepID=A0ABY4QUT5_9ACTN|nr:formimidoylglutamate deiminase [Jatrophihabitans telluris]UQX86826.1 formimidoylglutamate deiminase [Jatrophihabitans telluris]